MSNHAERVRQRNKREKRSRDLVIFFFFFIMVVGLVATILTVAAQHR